MRGRISLAILVASALAVAQGNGFFPNHGALLLAAPQAGIWQAPAEVLGLTTGHYGTNPVTGSTGPRNLVPPAVPPAPVASPPAESVPRRPSVDQKVARITLAVAQTTGQDAYTVAGKPTISVATIEAVLARYNSPMAGSGQTIYDLGVKYGIDPVYCLAFFVQESAAGTRGVAVLTHSMGNIRAQGGGPSLDGFQVYGTWSDSVRDWYRLIRDVYIGQWHLDTVDQIVPVYAPSSDDNDVAAYIRNVETLVATWRAQD